jgi:hypothetical protein
MLNRQLDEWRQSLHEDTAVEEPVLRMLRTLDRYLQHRPPQREERH